MDVIFTPCAGLDVHTNSDTACRSTPDATGQHAEGLVELKAVGTRTVDLLGLSAGLTAAGITPVALASPGEPWQPVCNRLAGSVQVGLVHAAQVKQVPGRKTEKAAARGRATLLRSGLLPASVMPPQGQRDRRDLTRDRTQVVPERSREVNRVHGILERANLKLAAVASEMMGVSGRAILAVLMAGRTDPATMAELAKGCLRRTIPRLEHPRTGLVRDHHRRLRAIPLAHLDLLDEPLAALRAELSQGLMALRASDAPPLRRAASGVGALGTAPSAPMALVTCTRAIAVRETMPGVDQRGAERWVAETGSAMGRFGTRPAWRPGPGWRRAMTPVRASHARAGPTRGARPCEQSSRHWPRPRPAPRGPTSRP